MSFYAPNGAVARPSAEGSIESQLADWTWERLVNRKDRYGVYVPPEKRRNPNRKAFTSKHSLTKSTLRSHFRGSRTYGLHSTSKDGTCKWLAIDIDAHGEVPQSLREANLQAAVRWHDSLSELGFNPLLLDSNGKGGFHLLTLFSMPVPEAVAFSFGRWLTRDWQEYGIQPVEVFPKQPERNGKGLGNWLRLPGRHHTHDFWSQAWGADGWLSWEQTQEFMLRLDGDEPDRIPEEAKKFIQNANTSTGTVAYHVIPGHSSVIEEVERGCISPPEGGFPSADELDITTVEDAIVATLPTHHGHRRRRIWLLARILKGMPEFFDSGTKELEWVIRLWWTRAEPFVATKDYRETWVDFVNAWSDVRVPYRQAVLRQVVELARASVPDPDDWYLVLRELCRRLACRGGGKFFLAQIPTSMALFGDEKHQTQICRGLRALRNEGYIEQTFKGHTGKASEYKWVGECL